VENIYLHDRIISIIGNIWAYKTSTFTSVFIAVPVLSLESEQSSMCAKGIDFASVSTILQLHFTITFYNYILQLHFGTVPRV